MISEAYRKQNEQCHKDDESWGTTAHHHAQVVHHLAMELGAESILDYGAGKQTLKKALPALNIFSYDPSIKAISKKPGRHDLVCCIDVMEHVEPEFVDDVLDDLQRVTKKMAFILISTVKAVKILPDGRNAHLVVEDEHFWLPKLLDRFDIGMIRNEGNALTCFVSKKRASK